MKPKTICMKIDNVFASDGRVEKEIRSLIESGYEVKVVAQYQNELPAEEKRDGYTVKRVIKVNPLPLYDITKALVLEGAGYYHAHNVDSLLPCYIAAKINHSGLIYDSHEYWKGFTNANNNLKRRVLIFLQRFLIPGVDLLISVNDNIIEKIRADNNYKGLAVAVLNAPYYQDVKLVSSVKPRTKKSIIHIGAIQKGRGLTKALDALKHLPNEYCLYFLGPDNFPGGFDSEVELRNLEERVVFLGKVNHDLVTKEATFADVSLVLTENLSENYYLSLPNKLFESMVAGLPVVASKMGVIGGIVKETGMGELCDLDNPLDIARTIENVFSKKDIYSKKSKLAAEEYNWEKEGKKLIKFYNKL